MEVTLMLDKKLAGKAEELARRDGISLSRLVESSLRDRLTEQEASFSERWRGRFVLAEGDDSRARRLEKKAF